MLDSIRRVFIGRSWTDPVVGVGLGGVLWLVTVPLPRELGDGRGVAIAFGAIAVVYASAVGAGLLAGWVVVFPPTHQLLANPAPCEVGVGFCGFQPSAETVLRRTAELSLFVTVCAFLFGTALVTLHRRVDILDLSPSR